MILIPAGLDSSWDQSRGSTESGYYNISLQMGGAANQIFATQLHNTLQSLLGPDDPFRGATAVVNSFSVTADARSLIGSTDLRVNLPALRLTPPSNQHMAPALTPANTIPDSHASRIVSAIPCSRQIASRFRMEPPPT